MGHEIFTEDIIMLMVFLSGYLLYYFSYESRWVQQLAVKLGDQDNRKEYSIHIPRLIGFLLLGVFPFLVMILFFDQPAAAYGVQLPNGEFTAVILLVIIPLTVLVSFFRGTRGINTDFYPQVRLADWTTHTHLRNIASWFLYLLGYEFILRGPLFFTCLQAYGLVPAVAINSVIYSLIHIHKGKGEAFGAIFLGILLCLIAYQTHSFLIPFMVHVILAIGNDLKALQAARAH